MPTALKSESFTKGDKLYQQRARIALPILVRQAQAKKPIFYADLAEEMEMPNARNLNYVLGSIGQALIELSGDWPSDIPQIQSLVVNQATGIPGDGLNEFIAEYPKMSRADQKCLVDRILAGIYLFPDWDKVLAAFNLPPNHAAAIAAGSLPETGPSGRRGGQGESEAHQALKERVAKNPRLLGLNERGCSHKLEYEFPSADRIDILFKYSDSRVGVEIKSERSDVADIQRGLFQCVKYQALLDAMSAVEGSQADTRCILAMAGVFPRDLMALRNTLGVEVIDNL